MRNNGGLAFPLPEGQHNYAEFGMTLRDYFAAKALVGELASQDVGADAMLEERQK